MRKSNPLTSLGIALIVCGVMCPFAAFVSMHFMPRKYTSACTIEVKVSQKLNSIDWGDNSGSPDPGFVSATIRDLQSETDLFLVIDDLKLVDKWSASLPVKLSKEQIYARLLGMVKISEVRNTGMLAIAVTSTDPQEAADIANTMAVTYLRMRRDDTGKAITNALSELSAEVEKERQKLEALKAELERIRTRDNVQDPTPDDAQMPVMPPNPEYEAAKKNSMESKRLLDSTEAKLQIDGMRLSKELFPAKILDKAAPARNPSSPNIPRIMMVSAGIGLLFVLCGTALFIIGLRMRAREAAAAI